MRRWLTLLLLLFLPFQFSWAAVTSYCQHETGADVQHVGHHEHKHHVDANHDGEPDTSLSGSIDNDCGICHASFGVATLGDVAPLLVSRVSFAIPWPPGSLASPPVTLPERPNWLFLA
jgi:hypothetical protein